MKEKPHERLDRLMNDRRLQLPKTEGKTVKWFQVAERAGITVTTLTALRKGQNEATEDTKRGVESALSWQPGSIDAILDGGEPTPLVEQRIPIGQAVEADSAGSAESAADPLAGLPDDPDERMAEVARRIEERSRENARITAERRRLAEEIARITAEETG